MSAVFRAPYLDVPPGLHMRDRADDYGSSSVTEADERYWRDLDIRTQVRLYGRQGPDPPLRSYFPAFDDLPYPQAQPASSTYGRMAPPRAEPSCQRNTSTMRRYAPRLDELNPSRMGDCLAPYPLGPRRPGIYDPRAPPAGRRGNLQGFASGPYSPFSQTNSSGWLNE